MTKKAGMKNLFGKIAGGLLLGKRSGAGIFGALLLALGLLCAKPWAGQLLEAAFAPLKTYAEETNGTISTEIDGTVSAAYETGARVFDEAGLFSQEEAAQLSSEALTLSEKAGFDCIIYTTEEAAGFSGAEELADYLYYEGNFGNGEEHSGAMLLIDMDHREYFVYTMGKATRYLTDSALTEITEEGIAPALSEGDFFGAAEGFLSGTEYAVNLGIREGQYDYNSGTGERDYAVVKPARKLEPWELMAAVLLSGIIGYLPCRSIRKSYAMETEKRMAQGFALAWRAEAEFHFAENASEAKLLNRSVSSVPIVVPRNSGRGGGRGGMGAFGGGRSTLSMGRGGRMHGGRGGRF